MKECVAAAIEGKSIDQNFKMPQGVGPKVQGEALVADDNFSTRYDLDRIKGVFSARNIS